VNAATAADFEDRVALVTGGGSGIGAAVAAMLAARGAEVVVSDVDIEAARRTSARIADAGGAARAVQLDVTRAEQVEQVLADIGARHGGLDLAVNSAGISLAVGPTDSYPLADWHRVIDINLNGLFYCLRFELAQMLRLSKGAIVNLASIAGVNGIAGVPAYVASKHAVVGLTKSCALEYATQGIRINAVAPGYVDTPLLAGRSPDTLQRIADMHPMARMAQADEIAEVVCFLLSGRASFVTGSVHLVDGGYSSR
jgi:NAD(P)-dependent dehydrogenase (short-subunit alcohol dehydrogenase family)